MDLHWLVFFFPWFSAILGRNRKNLLKTKQPKKTSQWGSVSGWDTMIFVVLRCFLGFCPGLCAIKEVSQTNSCLICDSNSFEALRFLTLSLQKRCPQEFEAPRCRGLRSLRKDPGCQWQKRIINGDDKSKKNREILHGFRVGKYGNITYERCSSKVTGGYV